MDEKKYTLSDDNVRDILGLIDQQIKGDLDRAGLLRNSLPPQNPGDVNGYHPNVALAQAFLDQARLLTILSMKLRTQR